jgi:hypothetical protein
MSTAEDSCDNLPPESGCPEVIDIVAQGAGDNTIRPCRPERRAALEAERDLLRRWGASTGSVQSPAVLDIVAEGAGDNTIRPCRPERRAALEAERDLLRRWGARKDTPEQAGGQEGAA